MSWRVFGSIDTFLLSLFFTHSAKAAGAIASTEVVTKLLLYYVHERAWARVRWGIGMKAEGSARFAEPEDEAACSASARSNFSHRDIASCGFQACDEIIDTCPERRRIRRAHSEIRPYQPIHYKGVVDDDDSLVVPFRTPKKNRDRT